MHEIEASDEQIGDSGKQQIVADHETPRVPGQHENTAGDDNAETFGKAVEQKEAVTFGHKEPNESQHPEDASINKRPVHHALSGMNFRIEAYPPQMEMCMARSRKLPSGPGSQRK